MRFAQLIIVAGLLQIGSAALAGDHAHFQVKAGQTAEIRGEWDKDGVFVAEEIELLPDSRRPKLRGVIEAVDSTRQSIRLFGQWVVIAPSTQFLDATDSVVAFSVFKPEARVEVSCKVDSSGVWIARHLRIHGVKPSNKIKGTITKVAYDDNSPDTLTIESISVLVTEKTEVFRTLGGSAEASDDADSADTDMR